MSLTFSDLQACALLAFLSLAPVTHCQVKCDRVLFVGEMRVLTSRLCLEVKGAEGTGYVSPELCSGQDVQKMVICEDGSIRNKRSEGSCLALEPGPKNRVVMELCKPLNGTGR